VKQAFDLLFEVGVLTTGPLDEGVAFVRRFDFDGRTKDGVDAWLVAHGTNLQVTSGRAATCQCDEIARGGPPAAADFTVFFARRRRPVRRGARRGRRPNSVSRWCARCASGRPPRQWTSRRSSGA